MKIFLEGQDRTGKDTLIKKIISEFKRNFIVLHYYATPEVENKSAWANAQYDNMFELLENYDDVILNRSHLGELVYPRLYGNYPGAEVLELEHDYELDIMSDYSLIVLVDEADNLLKREDGESLSVKKADKQMEKQLFEEAYKQSVIQNKILININGKSEDDVEDIVMKFLKDKK